LANQSITITLNDRLQAAADELVRILPHVPTRHWGEITNGANPQVLAAVSEQLAATSNGALAARLAQLKLDGASDRAMQECVIQWEDAYLISLQLDFQPRDYIAQQIEQIVCPETLRFLLHTINRSSYGTPLVRELALARLGQLTTAPAAAVPTLAESGLAAQQADPLPSFQ
jgi:hypothetical protein